MVFSYQTPSARTVISFPWSRDPCRGQHQASFCWQAFQAVCQPRLRLRPTLPFGVSPLLLPLPRLHPAPFPFPHICSSYDPLSRVERRARAPAPDVPYFFTASVAGGSFSGGFGVLSPMPFTFDSRSVMLIPDRVSNSAGTWAAILVKSPVIVFIPVASPLPVETTVILSTLASGAAIARMISGMLVSSLS